MGRRSLYGQRKQPILDALRKLTAAKGKPPTYREICEEVGISPGSLHGYMARLREEGLIEWQSKSHRSLTLVRQPFEGRQPQADPPAVQSAPLSTQVVAPAPMPTAPPVVQFSPPSIPQSSTDSMERTDPDSVEIGF